MDLKLVIGNSLDQFELLLTSVIVDLISVEIMPLIEVGFPHVDGMNVCAVDVQPAPKPNFVDETKFFIRAGNAFRDLSMAQANDYINMNWK